MRERESIVKNGISIRFSKALIHRTAYWASKKKVLRSPIDSNGDITNINIIMKDKNTKNKVYSMKGKLHK